MQTRQVKAALGEEPVDRAFHHALLFNPFLSAWEECSFGVTDGIVTGIGRFRARSEIDLRGARVVPGLIDAHVHLESSLLLPGEYARCALRHGTTTVIADPHEIANVLGTAGISWMLGVCSDLTLDVFFMLPSCVPSTPADVGGAVLDAQDLAPFMTHPRVLGLGEVMNVPGVLQLNPDLWEKLSLTPLIDGHGPGLRGNALAAYLHGGIQSDHESTTYDEGREKLARGMYLYLREGSTERNIHALAPLLTGVQSSRCSFATDDRHADILVTRGGIDDCIRVAVSAGVELETALRAATLAPAERFRLQDRGAVAPARLADFCILEDNGFCVRATYKRGDLARDAITPLTACPARPLCCRLPRAADLRISQEGEAWVIGLVPGEIVTRKCRIPVEGADLPDTRRDILKVVVVDRYRGSGWGMGLVQGFGIREGAIASSVAHDAHNLIAIGAGDHFITRALSEVAGMQGGMVALSDSAIARLPLPCAGLMSPAPGEDVVQSLADLSTCVARMGGIEDAFMYASFLALPVIPALRVIPRGLYDVSTGRNIPLFNGCQSDPRTGRERQD